MTWTILSMIAATACFSIKELAAHGKLRWSKETKGWSAPGFWSDMSWIRKYKTTTTNWDLAAAPDNWYYKTFKIENKERWPTSATLTVAFTDGMHLAQAGFKLFLALSFAPLTGWIWAGVIWLCWGISFTIFYRSLSR